MFRFLKNFDMDPGLGVLAIARSYDVAFDAEGYLG